MTNEVRNASACVCKRMLSTLALLGLLLVKMASCAQPPVYYANIGSYTTLQCNNGAGGPYVCFSTYTYQDRMHQMVMINNSMKYQVNMGSVTINNIQATDAGFYACSSNCLQMRSDMISYYLQPTMNGQSVDTTRNWIPIPPIPSVYDNDNMNNLFIVVSDERLDVLGGGGLSDGEIAGLVIGLFVALVIAIAIVTFLIIKLRRKKQKRDKINLNRRSETDNNATVDYSTIEKDYGSKGESSTLGRTGDTEKRSLTNNKGESANHFGNNEPDINTRNMRGPNSYKPSELNGNSSQSNFPAISIPQKMASQRSYQQLEEPPMQRAYQNQLDQPYDPNNGRGVGGGRGNKILFPSRTPPQQPQHSTTIDYSISQRYVSNDNLNQAIKESGFINENMDEPYDDQDDGFSKPTTSGEYPYQEYNENNDGDGGGGRYNPSPNQRAVPSRKEPPLPIGKRVTGADGSVTVVSARAPTKAAEGRQVPARPSQPASQQQQQPTKYSFQSQPQPSQVKPQQPPYYSQRIESNNNMSIPLQFQKSAASGSGNVNMTQRDGATDV